MFDLAKPMDFYFVFEGKKLIINLAGFYAYSKNCDFGSPKKVYFKKKLLPQLLAQLTKKTI